MQKSVHRILGRTRAVLLSAALLSGAALPAVGLWAGSASAAPRGCDAVLSCEPIPTHIRPDIYFNLRQTFTVVATLDSFRIRIAGQPVNVSTGRLHLCTATTDRHGVATCVLTYAESVAIRQNSGRYTVSFRGGDGYLPSSANGQAIIRH